jgi:cobalt/nickel transport system permease protein
MIGYAARRVQVVGSPQLVPVMGVLAAFIFAAQMLNFPVLGGTSGHLIGAALAAILLGPLPAFLTLTTVVIAQALFLQDGGLIALGANIFNLGAVASFAAYACYAALAGRKIGGCRSLGAAFAAGWVSVVLSAVFCALQLGLSGAVATKLAVPAMAGYHTLIGMAEGVLTAAVVSLLAKSRPDLLQTRLRGRWAATDWLAAALLVAAPCLILILAGSSALPDPMERLLESGGAGPQNALLSGERYLDYLWRLAAVLTLALALAAIRFFQRRKSRP